MRPSSPSSQRWAYARAGRGGGARQTRSGARGRASRHGGSGAACAEAKAERRVRRGSSLLLREPLPWRPRVRLPGGLERASHGGLELHRRLDEIHPVQHAGRLRPSLIPPLRLQASLLGAGSLPAAAMASERARDAAIVLARAIVVIKSVIPIQT
ncbi:uncharacterized protein LOC120652877 [Panicum virgatum]|uniref:uncharacterized protein LOC120652877 n=1 Tax=Panicum virgatum TaxID=38727 RepID=UPI0019D51A59|nr:uncharacterized protein LOC120652877 [Panicum virgatum]